jgi:hypothetical protein
MSADVIHPEHETVRQAVDTLAAMPLDELRQLAVRLDAEQRIVKTVLRERARRPAGRLGVVGDGPPPVA